MQSAMYNEAAADDELREWPEILDESLYIPSTSISFSQSFPLYLSRSIVFSLSLTLSFLSGRQQRYCFPSGYVLSKHTFLLDFRPCLTFVLYNFFSVSVSYIENNKEHTHFQSFFS